MTHYMTEQLDMETIYYLLQHPSLFISQQLYYQFLEQYFPNYIQKHPVLTQALVQSLIVNNMRKQQERREQHIFELNFKRVSEEINKNHRTKKLPNNLNVNVQLNNILHDTARKTTSEHRRQLDYHLDRIRKDLDKISKDGLIQNVDIKNNPEIQELRKKHQKQIQRQNKRIEKNKENRVKWMTEQLQENPHKYKVWQQTPNPKTRHTETNGQKVKLEEQFIVINDKTGDIDYVDYPGDWTCSPSNKENCLCNITFTNNPEGYVSHEKLHQQTQQQAQKIKQQKQNKTKTNKQQKEKTKHENKTNKNNSNGVEYTHRTMDDFSEYTQDDKEIWEQTKKDKKLYPKEFNEKTIFNIIKFQKFFKNDTNEHGMIIDYKTGKIISTFEGDENSIKISYKNVEDTGHLLSVHNHPDPIEPNIIQGVFQSPEDLELLVNTNQEKYSVVTSKYSVSIVKKPKKIKNKYSLYINCFSATKNYFKLLKEGNGIKNSIKIHALEMKKIYDKQNIKNYFILT